MFRYFAFLGGGISVELVIFELWGLGVVDLVWDLVGWLFFGIGGRVISWGLVWGRIAGFGFDGCGRLMVLIGRSAFWIVFRLGFAGWLDLI